jgi:hypothetical protein
VGYYLYVIEVPSVRDRLDHAYASQQAGSGDGKAAVLVYGAISACCCTTAATFPGWM